MFAYCKNLCGLLLPWSIFMWCVGVPVVVSGQPRRGRVKVVATDLVTRINKRAPWRDDSVRLADDDILLPRPVISGGSQGYSAAARSKRMLWPNGIITYKIDTSIRRRPRYMRVLRAAMEEWERVTCVRFVDKTNDRSVVREFVRVKHGIGCRASVGRWRNTVSYLTLGRWCDNYKVVLHELGHTLGFWHEQSRPDRDNYVTIQWKNIPKKWHFAFKHLNRYAVDSRGVPYDYNSIMHYGKRTYSENGRDTIVPRDPSIKYLGNTGLSRLDIKQTNILYKCIDFPRFPEDFFVLRQRQASLKTCIAMTEPMDPTWPLASLCYREDKRPIAIKWSYRGPIVNMNCTNIHMPDRGRYSRYWRNNFICVPRSSVLRFYWSVAGPISGQRCIGIRKTTSSSHMYHLCAVRVVKEIKTDTNVNSYTSWSPWQPCSRDCGGGTKTRVRSCKPGRTCSGVLREARKCKTQKCFDWPHWPSDFRYHIGASPPDQSCVRIYERTQYTDWMNHMMCWRLNRRRQLNLQWSDSGPVTPGMRCLRVTEPREPGSSSWGDNYLCVDSKAPYRFVWSSNGPRHGLKCLQWRGTRVSHGWNNNFLCAERYPIPSGCPDGWKVFRQNSMTHCYLLTSKVLPWIQARNSCKKTSNSELLSIAKAEELKFIKESVQKRNNVWIGFNDRTRERRWEWSDRTNVSYTNWGHREPNNGGYKRNEHCALMRGNNSKWSDFPCRMSFRFICKKSVRN